MACVRRQVAPESKEDALHGLPFAQKDVGLGLLSHRLCEFVATPGRLNVCVCVVGGRADEMARWVVFFVQKGAKQESVRQSLSYGCVEQCMRASANWAAKVLIAVENESAFVGAEPDSAPPR